MRTAKWDSEELDRTKQDVRSTLAGVEEQSGTEAKLEFALSEIDRLADEDEKDSQLYRVVYVMSALAHHVRHGGLKDADVQRLIELAEGLLRLNGIQPGTSRVSILYGELHLVKSQLFLKSGETWLAAWEQQVSIHLSGKTQPGGLGFQLFSMGIKSLRLGHAALATSHFEEAEAFELEHSLFERVRISRIRALRLATRWEDALALIAATESLANMSAALAQELVWEKNCLAMSQGGDPEGMLALTKKRGSHFEPSYVLEGFFWALASPSLNWQKTHTKMTTLARDKGCHIRKTGFFFKAACVLEASYDREVPFSVRLQKLGTILEGIRHLNSVDKELLLWLAIARWLQRNHNYGLATLAITQYKSLSLVLTSGRSHDALGIATDLIDRDKGFLSTRAS